MIEASDRLTCGIYSTDASIYQMQPLAVVTPYSREEVIHQVQRCAEHGRPLLARGAGTSLTGQTVNEAVVLDLSKHMNRILELSLDDMWVRVEPGVVCGELNAQLRQHNLHFAPDPATLNRATIGGMIGNNSAGMRSVRYGMTIDHVLELDLVLANGDVLHLAPLDEKGLWSKCQQQDREGEIYRGIQSLIEQHAATIRERYPKVIRRSGGYALDAFITQSPWNLAKLICGSEGTLGLILEAKLRLTPLPKHSALCLAHFQTLDASLRSAKAIVEAGASAAELIDGKIIQQARYHPLTREICSLVQGEPAALLVIEVQDDDPDQVSQRISDIAVNLEAAAYAAPIMTSKDEISAVWLMRSSALGLMTTIKGTRKPTPYIEDAAIPLENVADYVAEVIEVCKRYDQPVSMFGHVSVGLVHIRPLHDLHNPEEIERMKLIQADVFALVQRYGGSWSGEHGDGLVRGGYNRQYFGEDLYQAFHEVKRIFDPENRINPGKIINTPSNSENLRYGDNYRPQLQQTRFYYRQEGGVLAAVEQCSGVGACRKDRAGVMCPSYMATRDERHSTRGRANALRLTLSGQLGVDGFQSEELQEVMELCLACKGCKGECPNGVDMARLKAEVLYHYQNRHGVPLRVRFFASLPTAGKYLSGAFAPVVNSLLNSRPIRYLMGQALQVTSERRFPDFSSERLSLWFGRRNRQKGHQQPRVVLFNDTYTEFLQPQVGRAAVECLEAAGFQVELATLGDSQRIAITHGLLDEARKKGERLFQQLDQRYDSDLPIIVCEPSCASSLADDLPDLLEDQALVARIADRVVMFDHFVERELQAGNITFYWKIDESGNSVHFLVHGHCHQKATDGALWTQKLLKRIPNAVVADTNAGCCGMAGTFGYEKEHFELSNKIAQQRLVPKLNEARNNTRDICVVSNGFSCRHQIGELTEDTPIHTAQALRMYIQLES